MESTGIVRRDRTIAIVILLGIILPVGVIVAFTNGYFQQWEELPAPAVQPAKILTVSFGDVYVQGVDSRVYVFDHGGGIWKEGSLPSSSFVVSTRTCASDQPELSIITNVPHSIAECVTFTLAVEGSSHESYLIDKQGSVWVWHYSKGLIEYLLEPALVLLSVVLVPIIVVTVLKHKNKNQVQAA